MMDAASASPAKAARSSDRAVSIWGMGITAFAALGNEAALIVGCLAIPLLPAGRGMPTRTGLFVVALLSYALGSAALVITVPVALALAGAHLAAARALITLTGVTLLAQQFETLPAVGGLSIHPGSTTFMIMPALAVALVFGPAVGWRAIAGLAVGTVATLAMVDAGAARWINYTTFTAPAFRLGIALVPVIVASFYVHSQPEEAKGWHGLAIGAVVGAVVALALPTRPVTSVMFDEAHGNWETVQASFGPNDFGRVNNYTYGLLFKYAERVVGDAAMLATEDDPLPDDGLFVLKMPSQPLSKAFADRLEAWVRGGGRMLVVADHTDLYNTSQHLNAFLVPRFGLKLNADAVYNSIGMPTVPVTERFAALFGRVDAHGRPLPWQTGTSLAAAPANAICIAAFGPSYSEPGDYSRQNRFGPFVPRTDLRFTDHLAVAAVGVSRGAVAVILDSTPWSNFSQFKEQYRHMFRSIVHALERPLALQVWGWGAIALAGIAVIGALWRHPGVLAAGGLTLGLTLGASAQIGQAAFSPAIEGRDYGLRVVSGGNAHFEFLKQLVGPGQRNYARIVSAMAKYDLDPLASTPGSEIPDLPRANRWLLIEPDPRQLPDFEDLIPHLQRGGDLTVLFAPNQAAEPSVRQWLASFGLYIQKTVGLAVAEDARPGLLNRQGAVLLRDTRAVTGVLPTSLLKNWEFDTLLQSYTVRPTTMPRASGLLIVSFSADQFSDDAVGEVWEGIQPGSLGRHRERQLAAALAGEDLPAQFPDNLVAPPIAQSTMASLPAYALFENGKKVLSGQFDSPVPDPLSPLENPVGYLADLRDRAVAFVEGSCPKTSQITTCGKRLLGADSIEWMVTWAADEKGRIGAVELLHERRLSGMGSTVNVVFGR
jgi:hypothetical protein